MKKLTFSFFALFFLSIQSMQEPLEPPKPQIMNDYSYPDTPVKKHANPFDCGCLEKYVCSCFCFGVPVYLGLIILINKLCNN